MLLRSTEPWPSKLIEQIYYPLCDEDEDSLSHMLNEELDIDSDYEMVLEIEEETASKESSTEMSESESKTNVGVC
jgi:hypothetical protein